ncbi:MULTISPECIES: hypothetical protein [unclassified Streptomyces]|uniref:hypothetical protein n=2 Tax=Streptomyces TaxID=1883 RepID=UPI002DDC6475|nr:MULTISPECIES: hypothetical protein [unclassified Streptomyces]WSA96005.1 hypothetical protein OIE63_33960 [Streptomyces sp. NBC_01795]WSB80421.1 hypothetical protein OHB04_35070 [Streptomyces sp. NBC_01775]WSS11374.1 hypothetical protein OG533_05190 [Streptomyces sp. NBC_01186]WSS40080.1 hypothetical protein OG220_05285 [Streptomyces sp. NBC_01187]
MHGVVMERLAREVLAGLPDDEARFEVLELLECVQNNPRGYPDVREIVGAEVREAFGQCCWVRYAVHDGAIEVRDIGRVG